MPKARNSTPAIRGDDENLRTSLHTLSIQGYHLLHWSEAGMVYWMISELGPHDLMTLARILQAQAQQVPG